MWLCTATVVSSGVLCSTWHVAAVLPRRFSISRFVVAAGVVVYHNLVGCIDSAVRARPHFRLWLCEAIHPDDHGAEAQSAKHRAGDDDELLDARIQRWPWRASCCHAHEHSDMSTHCATGDGPSHSRNSQGFSSSTSMHGFPTVTTLPLWDTTMVNAKVWFRGCWPTPHALLHWYQSLQVDSWQEWTAAARKSRECSLLWRRSGQTRNIRGGHLSSQGVPEHVFANAPLVAHDAPLKKDGQLPPTPMLSARTYTMPEPSENRRGSFQRRAVPHTFPSHRSDIAVSLFTVIVEQ